MTHWIFWTGISFVVAGIVSVGITLAGEGPPSLIEELFLSSIGWTITGIVLTIFGLIKKSNKKSF